MAILQRLISSHCWWGGGEMGRLGRDDGTLAPIQRWGQRHAEMVVLTGLHTCCARCKGFTRLTSLRKVFLQLPNCGLKLTRAILGCSLRLFELLSQVIAALLGQLRSRIVRSRRQRPHLIL
jgi:hypothetical protein